MADEPVVIYRFKGERGVGGMTGIPARDITERDMGSLTPRQIRQIEASGLYQGSRSKAAKEAIADAAESPAIPSRKE